MCRYESHVTGVYLIGLDTDAFHSPHVAMMPIVPELLPELAWFATRVHQTIWTLKLKRNCPADDAAEVGVGGRDAEMQRCRDAVVLVFRAWCWAGLGWVRWWPVSGRADN